MGTFCRRIFKFVIIYWIIDHTASDLTICSDYLVSGLYGVRDEALTASSSWGSLKHEPPNARLHFAGDYPERRPSWSSAYTNTQQYIQVQFPRKTDVDAILIQGRMDWDQWVETYWLQYSVDGITWTYVTSPNLDMKLFTGNSDRNTVVKSSIDPIITAQYLRINPRSWHNHINLRFDVSGCYKMRKKRIHSQFLKTPMPFTESSLFLLFEDPFTTLQACSISCHEREACFSFTFGGTTCRGFMSVGTGHNAVFSHESVHYFEIEGTSGGFRPVPYDTTLYKVNERSMGHANAAYHCMQYQSRLIRIDSESKMWNLQDVIAGNTILMKNHRQLFVSGRYVIGQWKYSDGEELLNNALWSLGHPDASQGHCVMLTQTGLASVDCTNQLFSICEKV